MNERRVKLLEKNTETLILVNPKNVQLVSFYI